MITAKDIGKIYQEERKKKGLSVEQAYRASRIHPNVIEDIESGVFDRLNKLYVKSFLKKYADFLGLDPGEMIKKFETISKKIPEPKLNLGDVQKKEKKKKPEVKTEIVPGKTPPIFKKPRMKIPEFKAPAFTVKKIPLSKETIQAIMVGVLSIVLVVLVFVLLGMLKDRVSAGRAEKQASVLRVKKVKPADKVPEKKEQAVAASEPKVPAKSPVKGIAEKVMDVFGKDTDSATSLSKVILKLKATDKAWVQIKENDRIIYDGILEKGEIKTWESNGVLVLWTGKAGDLEFSLNGREIGVVAKGVVKNIKVSSKGIQIDDSWVAKL